MFKTQWMPVIKKPLTVVFFWQNESVPPAETIMILILFFPRIGHGAVPQCRALSKTVDMLNASLLFSRSPKTSLFCTFAHPVVFFFLLLMTHCCGTCPLIACSSCWKPNTWNHAWLLPPHKLSKSHFLNFFIRFWSLWLMQVWIQSMKHTSGTYCHLFLNSESAYASLLIFSMPVFLFILNKHHKNALIRKGSFYYQMATQKRLWECKR